MDCNVLRRFLVTTSTLNLATGAMAPTGNATWKIEPCGKPLFGDDERKARMCRSCADGWIHEHNYPCNAAGELVDETAYVRRVW